MYLLETEAAMAMMILYEMRGRGVQISHNLVANLCSRAEAM